MSTKPEWGTTWGLPPVEPHRVELALEDAASLSALAADVDLPLAYEHMIVTRGIDDEAVNLQRQGQLGVYASSRGQEAIQVASGMAARPDVDWVMPAYRELGTAVALGIDPTRLLHMWRGSWFSDYDYVKDRYGPQCIPVATQLLHATGVALGLKLDGVPGAVLTFVGDGATSEGDFHEALNFAGTFKVPCVFVVQNNGYAISVPRSGQTAAETLAYRGVGYGVPAISVDGNDFLACHEVVTQAMEQARAGEGPSLIEAMTYRMAPHTTSDDPTRYRDRSEEEAWAERDPIAHAQGILDAVGQWSDDLETKASDCAAAARQRVRDEIFEAPHGDPMELFEHVFVDPTGHYERQRQLLQAELDARGESGGA